MKTKNRSWTDGEGWTRWWSFQAGDLESHGWSDFFFFVYTPSTAELSAAWLKMLMIDLDNTGRVLEYTYFLKKNAIQCQLPAQWARKANISSSRHLLILTSYVWNTLGIMSCCMLSQIITLINERLMENSKARLAPTSHCSPSLCWLPALPLWKLWHGSEYPGGKLGGAEGKGG